MTLFLGTAFRDVANDHTGTLIGFDGGTLGNLHDTKDDVFFGYGGDDTIVSGRGNDIINGGAGADLMQGGLGDDRYYVHNALDRVIESAGEGNDIIYASASYKLVAGSSVETLATIDAGATAAINLSGNQLANAIYGNNGNNVINGGLGNDILRSNGGADVFVFDTNPNSVANRDTIVDYNTLLDHIQLAHTVFTGLASGDPALSGGVLQASQFHIGTAAHDLDDRIIYNSTTGALFYDADGTASGGVAAVQFATLLTHPPIDHADFILG